MITKAQRDEMQSELIKRMEDAQHPVPLPDIHVSGECLDLMEKIGGSFIKSLAHCYMMADPVHKAILRSSMRHWFEKYTGHVKTIAANAAKLEPTP